MGNTLGIDDGLQEFTNKTINANLNTITDIGTEELADKYRAISPVSALNLDWSLAQVFTKTLSANTVLTFSNVHIGVKDIILSGDYTLALPSWVNIIAGEYDGTVDNFIQVVCTNSGSGVEAGWCVISQEAV